MCYLTFTYILPIARSIAISIVSGLWLLSLLSSATAQPTTTSTATATFSAISSPDSPVKHPPHPTVRNGTRDPTVFAPACPQPGVIDYSEDCLYPNVWTSDNATLNDYYADLSGGTGVLPNATGSKYPVYACIYGGRFAGGASSVVVASMNYRLGDLGFLARPELSVNSFSGTSGSYGLVDQQAYLHWTIENCAAFGGDPTRITIGGQSISAAPVLDHLNSPLADGVFTQVIAESGARYPSDPLIGSLAQSYRHLAETEAQGAAYIKRLNVGSINEARDLPVEAFLSSEPPLFRPVIDGYVLPATHSSLLLSNNHSIVPVMTGNNKDDSGASPNPGLGVANYTSLSQLGFGSAGLADKYFFLYPTGNISTSANNANNAFHRDQSRIGTWLWANEQTAGAYHMSEINYAFNNLYGTDRPWTTEDFAIAEIIGNPNGDGLVAWPANSGESAVTMELGYTFGVMPVANFSHIASIEEWFSKWTVY
ncbi:alpha/beta-hydrolase [Acephala macrosclerotiorum]|nr:alpha/beta-hydrolase [Acephala macrosclerotiorum]